MDSQQSATVATAEDKPGCASVNGSARAWQCDLGNGEWDHDWQEYHESSGEVDGGPGDHWSYSVCLACGATKEEAQNVKLTDAGPVTPGLA